MNETHSPITVWGVAAGRGTTKGAARGAMAWRDYASLAEANAHENDWLRILGWRPSQTR